MSELRRLLDGGPVGESTMLDDWERALLRSARTDVPSPHARRQTAVALGVAVGALGVGATTAAAAATATVAGAPAAGAATAGAAAASAATGGAAVKVTAGIALLKWIGIGVTAGVVVLGAAHYARPLAPVSGGAVVAPPAKAGAPPVALAAPPGPPSVPEVTARAEEAPTPARAATAEPVAPRHTAEGSQQAPAPSAPASPRLADEVVLLDSARSALAADDAVAALATLDRHDRIFPDGPLSPEASVLRIEALARHGDDAAALSAARAFLARDPTSPHARRVRAIAESLEAKR
jgi:hypothetical protein